jgi:hypothetical protein
VILISVARKDPHGDDIFSYGALIDPVPINIASIDNKVYAFVHLIFPYSLFPLFLFSFPFIVIFEIETLMQHVLMCSIHPVPIQPPAEMVPDGPAPLPLTKKEQIKITKQNKLAARIRATEEQLLGIREAPKVRKL